MCILLGSDHGGIHLKTGIKNLLQEVQNAFEEVDCDYESLIDYPDNANPVAEKGTAGEFDHGILNSGTGIGMPSNKVKGIRCAVVSDEFSARMIDEHNNANILAIGERVVGTDLAKSIAYLWMPSELQGERHMRLVHKIITLEGSESQ